jgi:ferrous iron transport protein B
MLPNGNLETSYMASLGKMIAPLGEWMGFDWRLTVAILTSFLAKENSIATLGILFGGEGGQGLTSILSATYSTATALSFLVVSLLFIPCAATVSSIKQETNSWKWMWASIGIYLLLSITVGTITFNLFRWMGL